MTEGSSKTILLVEDDRALNRAVSFKLTQCGHTVVSAITAEEALDVLNTGRTIDIVWLDILLPGMNGVEFLQEVRKKPEFKELKVVVCSVSGRGDEQEIIKDLGALDYLVKSNYDLNDLVAKVIHYA